MHEYSRVVLTRDNDLIIMFHNISIILVIFYDCQQNVDSRN